MYMSSKKNHKKYESLSEIETSESVSESEETDSESSMIEKQPRKLTDAIKKRIAGNQYYKCANSSENKLEGFGNHKCPLWEKNGPNKGSFDASGYDIDHIVEFSKTADDS